MATFLCENGCGSEWLNRNHTRCELCGHNRGPYSIGVQAGHEDGTAAAYERCAELADAEAERIKHTSHKDGLGMGDQYAETACARIAATIRSLDEARGV